MPAISASLQILPAGTPLYIANMAANSIKRLTSVGNGKPTPLSALPLEWQNNPTWNNRMIFDAWCSGAMDINAAILHTNGGGHGDHAYNGDLAFDFNGASQPTGWIEWPGSGSALAVAPPNGGSNIDVYSDGRPTSVHTFAGLCFDQTSKNMVRFGGSLHPSGSPTGYTWNFNTVSNQWTGFSNFDMGTASDAFLGGTFVDPVLRRCICLGFNSNARVWDLANNTWLTSATSVYGGVNSSSVPCAGAYDYTRNRGILFSTTGKWLVSLNTSTNAVTVTTLSTTGASISTGGPPSPVFDPTNDCYWVYVPTNAQPSTLYRVQPVSPWAVTAHTLTGDIPTGELGRNNDDAHGHYNRIGLLKNWNALGLALRMNDNAYVIKLP